MKLNISVWILYVTYVYVYALNIYICSGQFLSYKWQIIFHIKSYLVAYVISSYILFQLKGYQYTVAPGTRVMLCGIVLYCTDTMS